MGKRKARPLRLAGDRQCDDGTGVSVQGLVTDHEHRPKAGLLAAADGIEISPVHLSSQYSGHLISSPVIPSSANALSSLRSSFLASTDKRRRRCRSSFSRTASSMARLRFRYSPDFTPRSISLTSSRSSVMAIFATGIIPPHRWYDATSYRTASRWNTGGHE